MQAIPDFDLTVNGEQLATSVAAVMLYQVLLGRDPENSFVIEEAKTQPTGALFRSFLRSQEFKDFVISPLKNNARLRHELTARAPTPEQLDWIVSLVVLPAERAAAIRASRSWREFFQELLSTTSSDAPIDPPAGLNEPQAGLGASSAPGADHPADPARVAAAALEEIAAIESRLERLKALMRPWADSGG